MNRPLARSAFGLVLLWTLMVGCGQAAQSQGAGNSAGSTDPVATIDGTPISRGDLEAAIAPQIAKVEEQAHQIRRAQLEELIAARLLEAEAKRRGVTAEALTKTEVTDKVTPLTQAEIDAFVQANRQRIQGDPAALMPQIRKYLQDQRLNERREAFLMELRGKAKIEVLLKAPPSYRAPIDLAGTPSRGPADAKVTVVEFSDFHCPYCRRVQATLNQLLQKYPTQVRLVYKHMPLDDLHPQARRAAEASWCAQEQGKFWEYHNLLYAGGPDASAPTLTNLASQVGLNPGQFQQCLADGKAQAVVQQHVAEGARYGVSGTPAFFVNGRFLSGAVPLDVFVQVIEEELRGAN